MNHLLASWSKVNNTKYWGDISNYFCITCYFSLVQAVHTFPLILSKYKYIKRKIGNNISGGINMSQKELNYLEDVYNHEKLIIQILNNSKDIIDDDNYLTMFENQIDRHSDLMSNLEKLMGDNCE